MIVGDKGRGVHGSVMGEVPRQMPIPERLALAQNSKTLPANMGPFRKPENTRR